MAFENVQIQSTRNGGTLIVGYREDLAVGETIAVSLTSTVGVSAFRWRLLGRPEGSVAGGAGPEPIELGSTASVSFTVDSDLVNTPRDGTYTVECLINEGAPTNTRKRVLLVRKTALVLADGRDLRMLGAFESDEDTSETTIRQGWANMLNRWIRKLVEMAAAGGSSNTQETMINGGTALSQGEVVRVSANDTVLRSQADSAANSRSTIGVAAAAIGASPATGAIITAGHATVLMQTGLSAVTAGQFIWVSPTVAGRGTNVQPAANAFVVGIIKDSTSYAGSNTVLADVTPQRDIPAQQDRVVVGEGATASVGSVAVGASANASGTSSINVGNATGTGTECMSFGKAGDPSYLRSNVFGYAAVTAGQDGCAFGHSANADAFGCSFGNLSFCNTDSVAVGYDSAAGDEQAVAIGRQAEANAIGAIAIGYQSLVSSANRCHIGSATSLGEITDWRVINNTAGISNITVRAISNPAADLAGLYITINNGAVVLRQVAVGAAGSGSIAAHRMLQVPN